ncbi:MAG: hypothetical protein WCT52_02150 [Candidatus Micrarchaeia archaeon]
MSEELTYKRLRDLAREEKVQPSLVSLPPDFYTDISAFLSTRFTEMESSRSVMQMREFENAVAIIREISTIRQQKILFKAIRNGGAHTGTDLMTKDEHELYDRFCAVIEDARSGLETLLLQYESKKKTPNQRREESGAKAAIDAQKGASVVAPASSLKKVRFLKEVPAYKGPNNETLGPFKPGEEGQLPTSEAEWLTRGKLAESLE